MEDKTFALVLLSWNKVDTTSVKGHAFYKGSLYKEEKLCQLLNLFKNKTELINFLIEANGQFSGIVELENEIIFFVDRIRTYPLFYKINGDKILITDLLTKISKDPNSLNSMGALQYCISGYCHGNNTLIENIFQVRAGELIVLSKGKLESISYHKHFSKKEVKKSEGELIDVIDKIADNLIEVLDGRQAIVSLSGGYDSRLVLSMLLNKGYENIQTYTYGKKNSKEINLARQVTDKLKLPWISISYDGIVNKKILQSENFIRYYEFAANESSMFFLQDFFAVQYLTSHKLLDTDGVFIPGHTGDILSGGHLSLVMKKNSFVNTCGEQILNDHCSFLDIEKKKVLWNIQNYIDKDSNVLPWNIYENWELKERQAKFIVNSTRVYEFFGHSFLLPLWDKLLMEYFVDLSFEQKLNSNFYKHTLKTKYFNDLGINFENEMQVSIIRKEWQAFKNKIKKVLPSKMVNSLVTPNDPYCYSEVIKLMISEDPQLKFYPPKQFNIWNAYLCQWYLWKNHGFTLNHDLESQNSLFLNQNI